MPPYCIARHQLRCTLTIAVGGGTILTLLDQGDVVLGTDATIATVVRPALGYLVAFVASNLGLRSGPTATATGGAT